MLQVHFVFSFFTNYIQAFPVLISQCQWKSFIFIMNYRLLLLNIQAASKFFIVLSNNVLGPIAFLLLSCNIIFVIQNSVNGETGSESSDYFLGLDICYYFDFQRQTSFYTMISLKHTSTDCQGWDGKVKVRGHEVRRGKQMSCIFMQHIL